MPFLGQLGICHVSAGLVSVLRSIHSKQFCCVLLAFRLHILTECTELHPALLLTTVQMAMGLLLSYVLPLLYKVHSCLNLQHQGLGSRS